MLLVSIMVMISFAERNACSAVFPSEELSGKVGANGIVPERRPLSVRAVRMADA